MSEHVHAVWGAPFGAPNRLQVHYESERDLSAVYGDFTVSSQWRDDPEPWHSSAKATWEPRLKRWQFSLTAPPERVELAGAHAQKVEARLYTRRGWVFRREEQLLHATVLDHFEEIRDGGCLSVRVDRLIEDPDTARFVVRVLGADAIRRNLQGGPKPESDSPDAERALDLLERYRWQNSFGQGMEPSGPLFDELDAHPA